MNEPFQPHTRKTIAVIMLHPGCNMVCRFCAADDNFDAMSMQQAVDLLKQLKIFGYEQVVFGGGEPFTWEFDIKDLLKKAKEMGFITQVGTNGIDLPAGFEKLPYIDRYILPLESIDETLHNNMRFYNNAHYNLIITRLNQLKKARRKITLSTVVTKKNIDQLPLLADFLRNFDDGKGIIHAWHLYRFIPFGRGGKKNERLLSIDEKTYHQACNVIKKMALPFSVYKRPAMYHSKSVEFFWFSQGQVMTATR